MTNLEYAESLRQLADVYAGKEDKAGGIFDYVSAAQPRLGFFLGSKDGFFAAAKFFPGTYTKTVGKGEYANVKLAHNTLPLDIYVSRDKLCEKVISYKCSPTFSAEDDKEFSVLTEGEVT